MILVYLLRVTSRGVFFPVDRIEYFVRTGTVPLHGEQIIRPVNVHYGPVGVSRRMQRVERDYAPACLRVFEHGPHGGALPALVPQIKARKRHSASVLDQDTISQCPYPLPSAAAASPKRTWAGWKLHIDSGDYGIALSCILTSASVHDSQVAIPLGTMTAQRVVSLYDLMDSAYDVEAIRNHSRLLGHVPIIDLNPRRDSVLKAELRDEARAQSVAGIIDAQRQRFRQRSGVERVNGRMKDEFGCGVMPRRFAI